MAFGKITIRSASGDVEEVELEKQTTSVGRQPGNDIVLNTSAVSRYHAQFHISGGRVYLVDLGTVNGTFVNDVQVDPGGRVGLANGDRIVMGDMMLVFSTPEARQRLDISLTPEQIVVTEAGLPFRVILDKPQQLVAPGARMQLNLVVENLISDPLTLDLTTRGIDAEWIRLSNRQIQVPPGDRSDVTLSLRPPRSSGTQPGRYALTVRVALHDDPNTGLEAVREIDVVGYAGLAMAVRAEDEPGHYRIGLHNQGNVPLELELTGYDREQVLAYRFQPVNLRLPPGHTERAVLRVARVVRRDSDEVVAFAVVAKSRDEAGFEAPVMALYDPPPSSGRNPLLTLIPLLLGALAVVALLAAGAVYFGLWPPPTPAPTPALESQSLAPEAEPATPAGPTPTIIITPTGTIVTDVTIASFDVGTEAVLYRTEQPVDFRWTIGGEVDAGRVQLLDRIGGQQRAIPITAADVESGGVTISAAELDPGIHNFQLVVADAAGEAVAQAVVGLDVTLEPCTVAASDAVVRAAPSANAAEVDPPREGEQVVVLGRTRDSEWVSVAYNDLALLDTTGWLQAGEVTCPPGITLSEFVALAGSASAPEPTASPTP